MRAELVIIGAGPVGLSSALALSDAGLSCIVVPATRPAEAAFGAVEPTAPRLPWQQPDLVNHLQARSHALWSAWLAALGQATGVDLAYRRIGQLLVDDAAARAPDEAGREWTSAMALDREPRLVTQHERALWQADFRQIRHDRLLRALGLALHERRLPVLADAEALALDIAGSRIDGLRLGDGRWVRGDAYIMASESAAAGLLVNSGLDALDTDPRRAWRLLFNPGSRQLASLVVTGDLCLVPQPGGRLLAIDLEPARAPQAAARSGEELLDRVLRRLPGLSPFDLESEWQAPLPGLGAGHPMLGAYPHLLNLWVNLGHCQNGLDIVPAMAELLADHLDGGPGYPELAVRLSTRR